MCGRTSLALVPEHLRPYLRLFGVADVPPWYTPRYNIAPSQDQLVVIERDGKREARAMQWGLVPFWARDPSIGKKLALARAETAATKPSYRQAFAKRRGLMVVDSYYEWRANAKGPKTPFRIHRGDGEPFSIAVLWERWEQDTAAIESCAVLTTAANEVMGIIHDRMPVGIAAKSADAWLSPKTSPAMIQRIIEGVSDVSNASDVLTSYAVSPYVNASSHDDALCWVPDPKHPE